MSIEEIAIILQEKLRQEEDTRIVSITTEEISYNETENKEINIRAQRIRKNLELYKEDLKRNSTVPYSFPVIYGNNWETKINEICLEIQKEHMPNVKLQRFYQLGVLLEEKNWNELARAELKKYYSITKIREVWKSSSRIYQLYSARGVQNLFEAKHISPFILNRMLKENFDVLLKEAKETGFHELFGFSQELKD
ncbi:hypothetical protein Glove_308g27 [Diversispora epigaea]|uniref:Uncharacterized protein n=1 Tax=Diversispora epigaea TaxID=1348612 RepID=A0A397HZ10_9GLOM|nr:hypothetical protein Glove_308g27 [Diversispora epigaea]